jgi:hypothetical protein
MLHRELPYSTASQIGKKKEKPQHRAAMHANDEPQTEPQVEGTSRRHRPGSTIIQRGMHLCYVITNLAFGQAHADRSATLTRYKPRFPVRSLEPQKWIPAPRLPQISRQTG